MLHIAMLSKWHVHAQGYAKTILNTGKADITVVWDDDKERGAAWAKELGCDYEPDLDKVLARSDVDAVVCDAPTTAHKDILIKAARAGKHVFTEKAMAPTVAECEEIAAEIEKAGITFTISLPQRTEQVARLAKKLIDDGALGTISFVRIRKAHSGVSGGWLPAYWFEEKDAAGGALMDLGCHPMYTAPFLLGKAKRLTSLMTAPLGSKVDENATVSVEFENGVIFNGETAFVSYRTPEILEVYGTEGTLLAADNDVKLYQKSVGALAQEPVVPKLPEALPIPLVIFIEACVNGTGTPEFLGPRDGVELTRLLENAYISDKENRTVIL